MTVIFHLGGVALWIAAGVSGDLNQATLGAIVDGL
jgi:hypothetical protein